MRCRHFLGELGDRMRRANARDDIFALGVDQIFAVKDFFAAGWVAGEGNSRRAGFAHVAEDHRLDVNRRAPIVRDPILPPINNGAIIHPRAKHRANRAP